MLAELPIFSKESRYPHIYIYFFLIRDEEREGSQKVLARGTERNMIITEMGL